MKKYKSLVYINPKNIEPHPNNPRKDLGDLTELVESVKKKGVMQNLTVIPQGEYKKDGTDKYTVIIGHRRLAAALKSGIEEVPCRIITDMTDKEQIATMLEENMQRTDLTVYEQAQGFQMMLDLGETIETLTEKTGFSKATIYHRINLAKLDSDILKSSNEDKQFTLKDYYELERIDDVDKRNEILKKSKNSNDLKWNVDSAIREIEQQKKKETLVAVLIRQGLKPLPEGIDDYNYYNNGYVREKYVSLSSIDNPDEYVFESNNSDDGNSDFYFYVGSYGMEIYKEKEEYKEPEESEEEIKEREEKRMKEKYLRDKMEDMKRNREECIDDIIAGKMEFPDDMEKVKDEIWKILLSEEEYLDLNDILTYFDDELTPEYSPEDDEEYDYNEEERIDILRVEEVINIPVWKLMLVMLKESDGTYMSYSSYKCVAYDKNRAKSIKNVYKILEMFGFTLDGEDKQVLDGTHEYYEKE